jgi:hypothetical protein
LGEAMTYENQKETKKQRTDWWRVAGIGLLISGGTLFIETQLHTGWLIYLPVLLLSGLALWTGIINQHRTNLILGFVFLSVGLVLLTVFSGWFQRTTTLAGISLTIAGISWLPYFLLSKHIAGRLEYWGFLISGILVGTGAAFLWRGAEFLSFVLWLSIGIGVPMLVWGYCERVFGILVAGSIILSSGVGVTVAWGVPDESINSLTRTGLMLIIFSLGWGGISVFSRRCYKQISWWPLIPAGVLVMSGGGLFIGGGSSGQYVGNTLSLSLIILGVYVLLLRSGFNRK